MLKSFELLKGAFSFFTKHVAGVELKDEPTVLLVGVGAEDGEDGALLTRLRQQLVHVHLPLGELEVCPRLTLVGAESNKQSNKNESDLVEYSLH